MSVFGIISYFEDGSLENLKNYRYFCNDRSILAKLFLQRWWNFAVSLVPTYVAPNLLTLIGLFHIILCYTVISLYYWPDYTPHAEPPSWIWLLCGYCIFTYQTLDAIDGKQARRTMSSSPLGELFDHGCDAVSTSLVSISLSCMLSLNPQWALTQFLVLNVTFYLAQYEEYHTGEMFMWYLNVTEAQVVIISLFLTTFIMGQSFWTSNFLPFSLPLLGVLNFGETVLAFCLVISLYTAYTYVASVFQEVSVAQWPRASLLLIPVLTSTAFIIIWSLFSPANLFVTRPHLVLVPCGFLYSTFVGKIVISRVVGQSYSAFQLVITPLALFAVNAYLKGAFFDEPSAIPFFWIWSIGAYLDLAYNVIAVMTNYLNINCLTLTSAQLSVIARAGRLSDGNYVGLPVPPTPTHRYNTRSSAKRD